MQKQQGGGRRTKPTLKKPKDYGINTKPTHKAIIYSVSFWFFYPPCCEKHINYFIMQNHPRISAGSQLGICPFTPQVLHQHLQLSPFAYQRYIRRSRLAHQPVFGIKVYQLPCGCFVWCYPSGVRELSALPFQGFAIALKQETPPQGQGFYLTDKKESYQANSTMFNTL